MSMRAQNVVYACYGGCIFHSDYNPNLTLCPHLRLGLHVSRSERRTNTRVPLHHTAGLRYGWLDGQSVVGMEALRDQKETSKQNCVSR